MPKIVASTVLTGGNQTVEPPAAILAGDTWVFVHGHSSTSASPIIDGFADWSTQRNTVGSNRISVQAKRYTAPSTDSVDITNSTTNSVIWTFLLRGVPENAKILVHFQEHELRDTQDFGQIDASGNGTNQLLIYCVCAASANRPCISANDLNVCQWNEATCSLAAGFKTMKTAGTTPVVPFTSFASINGSYGSSLIISIPDDGNGYVEQDVVANNTEVICAGLTARQSLATNKLGTEQKWNVSADNVLTALNGPNPTQGKLLRIWTNPMAGGGSAFQRHFFAGDCSGATCKLSLAPNTATTNSGTVSTTNSTDVLTATGGWTPVADAVVTPSASFAGLTANTRYYIINVSGNDFQVSTARQGAVQALNADTTGTLVPYFEAIGNNGITLGVGSPLFETHDNWTATGDTATDVITFSGSYTPADGDVVIFTNIKGGTSGITGGAYYLIRDASGQTAKITSSPGGTAANLSTANMTATTYHVRRNNSVGYIVTVDFGMDVDIATDVFTAYGWTPANDKSVRIRSSSGGPSNAQYYCINVSGQTYQLSSTVGGAAIDATTVIVYNDISHYNATGVASTDVLTAIGWTPADGMLVVLDSLSGGTNLTAGNLYRLHSVSGQDFKVDVNETTTPSTVNFTTDVTTFIPLIVGETGKASLQSIADIAASIGGVTALGGAGIYASASTYLEFSNNNSSDANRVFGPVFVPPSPVNLTGKALSAQILNVDPQYLGALGIGVIISDGTNWSAWTLIGKAGSTANEIITPVVDLGSATRIDGSGTVNLAAVTKIGVFYHRSSSASTNNTRLRIGFITALGQHVITGGTSTAPATLDQLKLTYDATRPGLIQTLGSAAIMRFNTQIGDGGTNPTTFDYAAGALYSPKAWSVTSKEDRLSNYGDDALALTLNLGASGSISFAPSLYVGYVRPKFTIHPDSDIAATKNFTGANFFNLGTWTGKDGLNFSSVGWTGCRRIMGEAATYTGCSITSSSSTVAAMQLKSGGGAVGCTFTRGSEPYAIEMPDEAGDTTLDLTDTTFTGYAGANKPLNLLKTTGTVTITLASGQTQPAYDTAGATVVWDQPILDTTWTNADLADGTTILVRNITTSATIAYVASLATGTGYTITLTPGVDYTVGDVIEIRQARKNVTTYYVERTSTIITTGGGGDIVEAGALELCTICNAFSLDGADYEDEFSLDSTDDEIDIDVAGNFQTSQIMVYWKYKMTQQAPMEEFWGAWSVENDGSFYNHVDVLPGKLDNTSAGDALETTRRRIHRSDGLRPIRSPTTSNYAVDVSWSDPVTTVETGVSGLTTEESDALLNNVPAIKNLMEADEIHTATTIEKRLKGTSSVLLTKNWTGRALVNFQAVDP